MEELHFVDVYTQETLPISKNGWLVNMPSHIFSAFLSGCGFLWVRTVVVPHKVRTWAMLKLSMDVRDENLICIFLKHIVCTRLHHLHDHSSIKNLSSDSECISLWFLLIFQMLQQVTLHPQIEFTWLRCLILMSKKFFQIATSCLAGYLEFWKRVPHHFL